MHPAATPGQPGMEGETGIQKEERMAWCWWIAVFETECHCTLKDQSIIRARKQIMPETTSYLEG